MIEIMNDCVDCAQGCRNCGRNKNYKVFTRDWCYTSVVLESDDPDIEYVNDDEICASCYEKYLNNELDEKGNEI